MKFLLMTSDAGRREEILEEGFLTALTDVLFVKPGLYPYISCVPGVEFALVR